MRPPLRWDRVDMAEGSSRTMEIIEAAYRGLLGRSPDAEGAAYYAGWLGPDPDPQRIGEFLRLILLSGEGVGYIQNLWREQADAQPSAPDPARTGLDAGVIAPTPG